MERLRPDPRSPWKPEYFVPRFVADAARAAGFRGILYCSTRFQGYNAVLFEWTRSEVQPQGSPAILEFSVGKPLQDSQRLLVRAATGRPPLTRLTRR